MGTKKRSFLGDMATSKYGIEGVTVPTPKDLTTTISLAQFVRDSWHVLESSTALNWNWHIDAVCLHAEAIFKDWHDKKRGLIPQQRMQNLLINIPPGSMKSRIISVCLPAWAWLYDPSWKAYFIAANPTVATRDSMYCKEIIASDWYQNTFKPTWHLSKTHNNQKSFANTQGGFRKAFGFFAKITGDRSDCLVCDDPHDANEVSSTVKRLAVLSRWDTTIYNRVNDLRISVRLIIMQRLHEDDLAGHVFSSGAWKQLIIEQEFTTPQQPSPIGWTDPRTKPGELMFPERFPLPVLVDEKSRLGSYGYSGQHQQRPSPDGGGMFKIENWRIYIPGSEKFGRTILSMDAAFKGGAKNDYVVIAAVRQQLDCVPPSITHDGVFRRHRYYVPHLMRLKADIIQSQAALRQMAGRFPFADKKLIEDKANGSAIVQQMSLEMRGIEPIDPGNDSKTSRAQAISPVQERGDICLPVSDWAIAQLVAMGVTSCTLGEYWAHHKPSHTSTAEHAPVADWVKDFIDEAARFPNSAHDDQVDALTQAVLWYEANQSTIAAPASVAWA